MQYSLGAFVIGKAIKYRALYEKTRMFFYSVPKKQDKDGKMGDSFSNSHALRISLSILVCLSTPEMPLLVCFDCSWTAFFSPDFDLSVALCKNKYETKFVVKKLDVEKFGTNSLGMDGKFVPFSGQL